LVARLYGRDAPGFTAARRESLQLLDVVGIRGKADARGAQLTLMERKRVEIARALATQPRVLLLDEPLAGLNPTEVDAALNIFRRIRYRGMTVVLVEHNAGSVRALWHRTLVLTYGQN